MRKFKFRAWNPDKKEMLLIDQLNFNMEGEIIGFNSLLRDDWILMQYTGLKDKNGKEIYEGDILQYLFQRTIKDETGLSKIIEEKAYVNTIESKLVMSCGCCATIYGWEISDPEHEIIIGNIYQNPELLNNGQK